MINDRVEKIHSNLYLNIHTIRKQLNILHSLR